jgi:hypothetical protein
MTQTIAASFPWSPDESFTANERIKETKPKGLWLILGAFVAFLIIMPFGVVYLVVPELFQPPIAWGFLVFLILASWYSLYALFRLTWPLWKSKAYQAKLRQAEARGDQVEWQFSPEVIEHRVGSAAYTFQWKNFLVTRFLDGFVLSTATGPKCWVPCRGFADPSTVETFAALARQRALYYQEKYQSTPAS